MSFGSGSGRSLVAQKEKAFALQATPRTTPKQQIETVPTSDRFVFSPLNIRVMSGVVIFGDLIANDFSF